MTYEEFLATNREVTGETFVLCYVCGDPIGRDTAILLDRTPTLTEPPEPIWVCPTCQRAIELGEIDLESIEREVESIT